jgi:hypothetical protein
MTAAGSEAQTLAQATNITKDSSSAVKSNRGEMCAIPPLWLTVFDTFRDINHDRFTAVS